MYSGVPVEIPILRPSLPHADTLVPRLQAIDATRYYTNFGPLVQELEEKISESCEAGKGGVITICNGTVALQLSLLAEVGDPPPGTLCLMPAWTFIASACAAWQAGLTPYFVDVDPTTWALDPEVIAAQIQAAPGPVGAVMVVAPFGSPVDHDAWLATKEKTGVPVIVDAAAGFDSTRASALSTMVSLHATKGLGVGEGAVVVSTNAARIAKIKSLSVFGFSDDRISLRRGTNAKMSEYTAAVGLASLDAWPESRRQLKALKATWMGALAALPEVTPAPGTKGPWQSTTFNVVLPGPYASAVKSSLASEGIDSRQWWGLGCHTHPAFEDCPRAPLPNTDQLAASSLGLPFYHGLTDAQIERITAALGRALKKVASGS